MNAGKLCYFYRWILPIISTVPVLVGIIGMETVGGPPDQKAEASMVLAFILFPISFVLAVISAVVAWLRWRNWTRIDRVVALVPLCVFVALILLGTIYALFG